jgi:NAD(P)-dependent dehydrogenase (short-subunit alcohol dehydrogenase family)
VRRITSPRCIVVTGAASGIGKASAKRFAADGDFVVVADCDQARGREVVASMASTDARCEYRYVDVADEDSVSALAAQVMRAHGPPHALVNSAGILQNVTRLETFDLDEHDRIWAVNYRGTYLSCRAFAPRMAEAGRGAIVNISSTSSVRAFPLHAYGPGKTAINQLTAILAADLGPRGVRVNSVIPGYVLTEQMQARIDAGMRDPKRMHEQSAMGRMVSPEEIADGIHFLCSSAAGAITGIGLPIDAGWLAMVTYRQHPGWPPAD